MRSVALIALAAGACSPYMTAGYDATTHITGPVATKMNAPAEPQSNAFSFAFGGRFFKRVGLELGTHLHDTAGQVNLASASLEGSARWLEVPFLYSDLHAGPAKGLLVDRMTGYGMSSGYRAGIDVGTQVGPLTAFLDFFTTTMTFDGGPAPGSSRISGVTLGIGLR